MPPEPFRYPAPRHASLSGWCCRCAAVAVPTRTGGDLPEWCAECEIEALPTWRAMFPEPVSPEGVAA